MKRNKSQQEQHFEAAGGRVLEGMGEGAKCRNSLTPGVWCFPSVKNSRRLIEQAVGLT
ncbi:MAG TPA: hypothetical protein VH540_26615 [Ktedonobacterales bacterium]